MRRPIRRVWVGSKVADLVDRFGGKIRGVRYPKTARARR